MAIKTEKQQAMFALIETWKGSGQRQQEFCKANGLAYSGFHYWYKKYRQQGQGTDALPSFVPVHIQPAATGPLVAELVLPNGRRLNFYRAVDASFLRTLLS